MLLAFINKVWLKFFVKPYIRFQIACLNDYQGVTCEKRELPIIVSFCQENNDLTVLLTSIYSILNQSVKPDRIILWLNNETQDLNDLPYELTKLIKNGLEIRFVKEINKYTKTICPLREFKNSIIVTVDSSMYYSKNWLRKLYLSYIAHPEDVQVHRAYKVILTNDNKIEFGKLIKEDNVGYSYLMEEKGGILYPPKTFSLEVFRKDIYQKYLSQTDLIWLWTMAVLNDKKIRIVQNNIKNVFKINIAFNTRQIELNNFDKVQSYYGKNLLIKLKKECDN